MTTSRENSLRTDPRKRFVLFWICAGAGVAVAALLAAHAPLRMKLIGLFPMVLGVASGAGLALLGRRTGLSRNVVIAAAVLLVPGFFVVYAVESFRVWREARIAHVLTQPGGKAIAEHVESGGRVASSAEAELIESYRSYVRPEVATYLVERVQGIAADISERGAVIFAGVELLLGIAAGVATAIRLAPERVATALETSA